MRNVTFLAALSMLAASPAAGQEPCAVLIDQLAAAAEVPAELPEPGEGETLSDTLAQSGGVIEPPQEGRTPIIEPPPIASDMPTAPPVGLPPPPKPPAPDVAGATLKTQVDSLLVAAREALDRGDESACRERVGEAMALLEQAPD